LGAFRATGSEHALLQVPAVLCYGAAGINRVRYDNERGKGDHRHLGNCEEDYVFTTVEQLLADFESDVNEWS